MPAPEIITFGCRLNAYESQVIAEETADQGLEDAIVFNTCAVTSEATRQARQAIRRAKRDNPDKRIIVTGCAAQVDPNGFAAMEAVDLVIGNSEKFSASNYTGGGFGLEHEEKIRVNDIMSVTETAGHMVDGLKDRTRAFVQIQNGCDHRCTFCIIPFGRGNSRSVPAGDVVRQVRNLAANGYREVVLTGVDITAYGHDLPGGVRLGSLIAKILQQVPELDRLRLSSIDSIEVDEHLWRAFAEEDRLMPHVHLSLQSGDDLILKRMKRRHLRDHSVRFCQELRGLRPDVVFGADIIAGFPTETEGMFENSLRIIEDCGLTYLHVFPYSARPGTPAAQMPQVPAPAIKERARRLRLAGRQRQEMFFAQQVGQTRSILVESSDHGRTEHFALVHFAQDQCPGQIITTRITGMNNAGLISDFRP